LDEIARIAPTCIESITLPLFFHDLPDNAPDSDDDAPRDRYREILAALTRLCIQPALFETLIVRILSKVGSLVESTDIDVECQTAYIWDLLSCLSNVIVAKAERKHVDLVKHFDRIMPRLSELLIRPAVTSQGPTPFTHPRLIGKVAELEETLVWQLPQE
jgi:DNA repair/transcription protein MET18/MMS19